MEYIAKNQHFEIAYDVSINRVFINLIGHWTVEIADDYLKVINQRLKPVVKSGFDMFIDATEFVTLKSEAQKKMIEAQKLALIQKVRKVATLQSRNVLTKFQGDEISNTTQLPKGVFLTKESALKWLDEKK